MFVILVVALDLPFEVIALARYSRGREDVACRHVHYADEGRCVVFSFLHSVFMFCR